MSKCISRHGEYGEHELEATGDHRFICKLCWAFDEDLALDTLSAAEAQLAKIRELRNDPTAWRWCYGRRVLFVDALAAVLGVPHPEPAHPAYGDQSEYDSLPEAPVGVPQEQAPTERHES